MKALFNDACCLCHQFKPGCAEVHRRLPPGGANEFILEAPDAPGWCAGTATLCPDCRRACRGTFRYAARHRDRRTP